MQTVYKDGLCKLQITMGLIKCLMQILITTGFANNECHGLVCAILYYCVALVYLFET